MYIGDYLGRREIYSPDKPAIVDAGKDPAWRFTYREMNERANRYANWLREAAGVEKGDRVAILARDGVEHLDSFFACGKLGAIHTALNWRLHWREVVGLVEQTQPKVLLYSDDFIDNVRQVQAATRGTAYEVGRYLHIEGGGVEGSQPFETVLAGSGAAMLAGVTATKDAATGPQLLWRAVLCNALVCLALWMAARTRSDGAKLAVLWWALLAFIASGFEHSVANVTVFGLAALDGSIGWDALARNLLWTVPGNVLGGGVVIGLGYAW